MVQTNLYRGSFVPHLLVHLEHLLLAGVQCCAQVSVCHCQVILAVRLLSGGLQGTRSGFNQLSSTKSSEIG